MITNLGQIFITITAILHIWFFVLEAFLWQKPLGRKIFKLEPEFARRSAPLAANQGLYNLFLSAGLFWSLLTPSAIEALHLKFFFLTCIILAGIYGGLSVSKRILWVQALPAFISLILVMIAAS